MIKPFESLLSYFNMDSMDMQKQCECIGAKYKDGKFIYRHVLDIQELSTFTGIEGVENYVKVVGMYNDGTKSYPLKITSISSQGIELDLQTIEQGDTGYCDVYFTKTESNPNPMSKFIVTAMIVLGVFMLYKFTDMETVKQLVINNF